jgi:hypothetical protein
MVVGSIYLMRDKLVQAIWPPGPEKLTRQALDDAPKVQPPVSNPPEFPIPGDYGVYAINEGKLKELDMLSEQIPDKRIAMSTPVTPAEPHDSCKRPGEICRLPSRPR